MEDLGNATVEDVKAFHKKFYSPNNATLVVAGDINKEEIKALVEKYFGEISRVRQSKSGEQCLHLCHQQSNSTTKIILPKLRDLRWYFQL